MVELFTRLCPLCKMRAKGNTTANPHRAQLDEEALKAQAAHAIQR